MWIEELKLENIRCFENQTIRFARGESHYRWVTFLSENGGGKSTALQALALLLAGPEGAQKLLPRPVGWLRNEDKPGKISVRIHQGDNDPGQFGKEKVTRAFGYTFFLTGSQKLTIRNKTFTEPTIQESGARHLTWLRQNALTSKGTGWFAVGYGAFRRLTRSSQIIVPSLQAQARFTNFSTQFDEDQPLSAFERWMVYLDYRIVKENDTEAQRQKELGVLAINKVLPAEVRFDSVTAEGRILFNVDGQIVPTIALSDGYRSILALAGDLIWRLIAAYPKSDDPLKEEGIVLIDELDIHLHPIWQRDIAGWLAEQFPNLQFVVATHSPLIAAGAGDGALTLRFHLDSGSSVVERVENIAAMNVDRILQSEAFGLVSPYSPQTQGKIDRYDELARKGKRRSVAENDEFQELFDFMKTARPIGGPPPKDSNEAKIEAYLEKALR
ncbi:MAG: AAA family ATPase [Phycisphaerae bacterium]|nr:AAA family ATPase [Phycisphaerae bacterium]